MGNALSGKRVVIAGSRKTEEMSQLIEKQGGTPIVRSLQGTVFLAEKEVEPDLKKLVSEGADFIIFTTGIGTETLLNLSEKRGLKEQFLKVIEQAEVASRGYKTLAALKKINIKPVAVDEDGTTEGLIRALTAVDFKDKHVMVQLHGISSPRLVDFLEAQGASVTEILPYQHTEPEEETVKQLYTEILNGEVDAVCFTTAIQVKSLMKFAKEKGHIDDILHQFRGDTPSVTAVSVGKVTSEALREEGIDVYVAPKLERMGAMIIELARYYEGQAEVERK
jgi:uroporphyrinogen-III synthase